MPDRPRFARAGLGRLLLLLTVAGVCIGPARAQAPSAGEAPSPAPAAGARLGLIVAPARILPGGRAIVRIVDTWGRGAVSARVCARTGTVPSSCHDVRLETGQVKLRKGVRLPTAGRWTITLRAAGASTIVRRTVRVAANARHRVLVTGDSMVYGIIDVLARTVRRSGGVAKGDPHPGSGITKPSVLRWPEHARASAGRDQADATVVDLGAVDSFPFILKGERVACCGPAWVAEYVRQLRQMMSAYLRGGSALVYWVLLPAPRDPDRVASYRAINGAIAQAAATFPDGVRVVDIGPAISPGDVYREKAMYRGRLEVIRDPDGLHLARAGIHLATEVIELAMRRDGMVR